MSLEHTDPDAKTRTSGRFSVSGTSSGSPTIPAHICFTWASQRVYGSVGNIPYCHFRRLPASTCSLSQQTSSTCFSKVSIFLWNLCGLLQSLSLTCSNPLRQPQINNYVHAAIANGVAGPEEQIAAMLVNNSAIKVMRPSQNIEIWLRL